MTHPPSIHKAISKIVKKLDEAAITYNTLTDNGYSLAMAEGIMDLAFMHAKDLLHRYAEDRLKWTNGNRRYASAPSLAIRALSNELSRCADNQSGIPTIDRLLAVRTLCCMLRDSFAASRERAEDRLKGNE